MWEREREKKKNGKLISFQNNQKESTNRVLIFILIVDSCEINTSLLIVLFIRCLNYFYYVCVCVCVCHIAEC